MAPVRQPATRRGKPPDLALLFAPHLHEAATEIDQCIRQRVPRFARRSGSRYAQRMHETILHTAERFVAERSAHDDAGRPGRVPEDLLRLYAELGAHEAKTGHTLDALQTAIWTGGRVACRRITMDAYRFGWPQATLAALIDELFGFLDAINGSAGQAFADTLGQLATERERLRGRLCTLLVADPAPEGEAIARLAAAAQWEPAATIGVVALLAGPGDRPPPVLPPMILAHWEGPDPYLVVPDPDGPGRHMLLRTVARCGAAALGPTVPLTRGGTSLRWARHTAALMRRGLIPEGGLVSTADNLPTLAASRSEDLVESSLPQLLGPLLDLPANRREPLITTLEAHLKCGENTMLTAERIGVHQRTVRARLRRLEELYGGTPCPPEQRLDLMLVLHWYLRSRATS